MVTLIVFEGHSSKTLIELEKRVRDVSAHLAARYDSHCRYTSHGQRLSFFERLKVESE
jgi:hypothetical protein